MSDTRLSHHTSIPAEERHGGLLTVQNPTGATDIILEKLWCPKHLIIFMLMYVRACMRV